MPQHPTADSPHTQADHYEGVVEDSWGTLEHCAWNTWWMGVTLSTPACSPEGQDLPYPYPQGSSTPTLQSAALRPRSGQPTLVFHGCKKGVQAELVGEKDQVLGPEMI